MQPKKNIPAVARLFRLVSMLTPVQKRAFKRDARFWSDSSEAPQYVAMFDAVNRHLAKGGSEDALLEVLLLLPNGFNRSELSTLASYLYEKILGSMRFVPDSSLQFNALNGRMQDVSFLYNKALFSDCLPVLQDALKLAQEIDRPAYVLELSLLERRIVGSSNFRDSAEQIKKISLRETEAIRQIRWFTLFSDQTHLLMDYIARRAPLPPDQDKKTTRYIRSFLPGKETLLQPRARYLLLRTAGLYYTLKSITDLKEARRHAEQANAYQQQIVELYDNFRPFKEEEFATYVNAVDLYLQQCLQLGKADEVEGRLLALEQEKDDLLRYRTAAFLRIQMLNSKGDYAAVCRYLEDQAIAKNVRRLHDKFWPSRLLNLWFMGIEAYFFQEDYRNATQWCRYFLAEPRNDLLPDVKVLANLLLAIATYQMAESRNDTAAQQLDNTIRNFQLRKGGDPRNVFLYQLIRTLKKAFEMRYNANLRELVEERLESLSAVIKNTPTYHHYSFPLVWMYAQLSKQPVLAEMKKWRAQNATEVPS